MDFPLRLGTATRLIPVEVLASRAKIVSLTTCPAPNKKTSISCFSFKRRSRHAVANQPVPCIRDRDVFKREKPFTGCFIAKDNVSAADWSSDGVGWSTVDIYYAGIFFKEPNEGPRGPSGSSFVEFGVGFDVPHEPFRILVRTP